MNHNISWAKSRTRRRIIPSEKVIRAEIDGRAVKIVGREKKWRAFVDGQLVARAPSEMAARAFVKRLPDYEWDARLAAARLFPGYNGETSVFLQIVDSLLEPEK